MKELLFTITKKDFRVECFPHGGKGGQKANRCNCAVRLTHIDSGAVGESRESRSQIENKRVALRRLVETEKFKIWHRIECGKYAKDYEETQQKIEKKVDNWMKEENLIIESFDPTGVNNVNSFNRIN